MKSVMGRSFWRKRSLVDDPFGSEIEQSPSRSESVNDSEK
jgi:hypothetical protein